MSVCMEVTSGVHSFQDENNSGHISCIHCGEKEGELNMDKEIEILHEIIASIDATHKRSLDADNALLKVINIVIDRVIESEKRINELIERVNMLTPDVIEKE